MDVVSLYLGWEGVNGSVIMGGFDEGLIDHGYNTVFSKENVNSEGLIWSLPPSSIPERGRWK